MTGAREESSALVSANRRRTTVVLLMSAALVVAALGWASVVSRGRPSAAEVAGADFYAAVLREDCAVVEALLTGRERSRLGGAAGACETIGAGASGRVAGTRTAAAAAGWAVVLVEVEREDAREWWPVGVRYEAAGGRWRVARVRPSCLHPRQWVAPSRCARWDWP